MADGSLDPADHEPHRRGDAIGGEPLLFDRRHGAVGHRVRGVEPATGSGWYVGGVELVERAGLLVELRALLAQARGGSGRVVLLGGEAGVGKTSLIREFVAGEPGLRVLWGSCEPLVTPEPLGPFHDMPEIAPAILQSESRIELLGAILDQLRTPPGTVLIVEDAHWADEASLDVLRYLGRRVYATPGMLVLTFRDDEASPGSPLRSVIGDLATAPGCRRLHVPPLSAAAVAELADGIAVDAGRLHATTGGNPFFVTEVLAAPGWTVPPTIGDAVLARVARLDPVGPFPVGHRRGGAGWTRAGDRDGHVGPG